jgi:hypothetical protein
MSPTRTEVLTDEELAQVRALIALERGRDNYTPMADVAARLLATIDKMNEPTGRFLDGLRWRDERVRLLDEALRGLLHEILLRMEKNPSSVDDLKRAIDAAVNALKGQTP